MAIGNTKIMDLDSHLVGDVPSWERFIDDAWTPTFRSGCR